MSIKDNHPKKSPSTPKSNRAAIDFMPKDSVSTRILLDRARKIAEPITHLQTDKKLTDFIRFKLGSEEYYGIPYTHVKEVMQNIFITHVPGVPDFIAGIMNYRGKLTSVINLKKIVHMTDEKVNQSNNIIIITFNMNYFGFLVDHIEGSSSYDSSFLEPSLSTIAEDQTHYFLGLYQSNTAIMNVEGILNDSKFKIF